MSIMPINDNAAACGISPQELWRVTGTGVRDAGRSAHCAKTEANACRLERNCHKMPVPGRVAGCERSGLQFSRRTVAAPSRGVFLFGGCSIRGVIASVVCTGVPRGNPSGLLCPREQSANPRGAAHPLAEGCAAIPISLGGTP